MLGAYPADTDVLSTLDPEVAQVTNLAAVAVRVCTGHHTQSQGKQSTHAAQQAIQERFYPHASDEAQKHMTALPRAPSCHPPARTCLAGQAQGEALGARRLVPADSVTAGPAGAAVHLPRLQAVARARALHEVDTAQRRLLTPARQHSRLRPRATAQDPRPWVSRLLSLLPRSDPLPACMPPVSLAHQACAGAVQAGAQAIAGATVAWVQLHGCSAGGE